MTPTDIEKLKELARKQAREIVSKLHGDWEYAEGSLIGAISAALLAKDAEIERLRAENDERGQKINEAVVELLVRNAKIEAAEAALKEARKREAALTTPRYITEWHEDMGNVLWWSCPVVEAPYVGSPLGEDFDENWHTWWTPLPDSRAVQAAFDQRVRQANEARSLLSKQGSGKAQP